MKISDTAKEIFRLCRHKDYSSDDSYKFAPRLTKGKLQPKVIIIKMS